MPIRARVGIAVDLLKKEPMVAMSYPECVTIPTEAFFCMLRI